MELPSQQQLDIAKKNPSIVFYAYTKAYEGFIDLPKNFNIIDEDDKIELLRKLDVDYYISFEFDSSLASLTPEKFILEVLVNKLKIKNITVGYDFKFGKDRKGNNNLLKKFSSKYKYKVLIIDRIMNKQDLLPYSSTYIREHISKGDFKKVSLMLFEILLLGTLIPLDLSNSLAWYS